MRKDVAMYDEPSQRIAEQVVRIAQLFIINEDPFYMSKLKNMFPELSQRELDEHFDQAIQAIEDRYRSVNAHQELMKSMMTNDLLQSSAIEILGSNVSEKIKLACIGELRNLGTDRRNALVQFGLINRLSQEKARERMALEKKKKTETEELDAKSEDELDKLDERTDKFTK